MSDDNDRTENHDAIRAQTMRERRSGAMQSVGNVIAFPRRGVAPPFDRVAWFREYHGLTPGVSACPSCGRVVEATDASRCGQCGRPYPYRCHGLVVPITSPVGSTAGNRCQNRLEPVELSVINARGVPIIAWDDSERSCADCQRESRRVTRAIDFVTTFRRAGGDERERYARDELMPSVLCYAEHEQRADLDAHLAQWLRNEGPKSLFAWGGVGCGKTVAVFNAAYRAYVHDQIVHSFLAVEQGDLLKAYRAQYGDVPVERREEAARLIESLKRVDLLVVDEMFSFVDLKNPWTATAAQDLGEAFRYRFDAGKRTLFTSNANPKMGGELKDSLWAKTFDERMADRARTAMVVVHVQGKSLRQSITLPLPFGDD